MQNRFIVKMNNGNLLCFFHESGNIFFKKIKNGICEPPENIISDVRELYTVNLLENGEVYLFCQNTCGDIVNLTFKDEKITKNVILKNNGKNSKDIIFYCVKKNSKMTLIYNIPTDHSNFCDIMQQSFNGKNWSSAKKIDTAICMNDFIFKIQMRNFSNGVVFYQKKGKNNEINIGCREFNIDEISEYTPIYSTTYKIIGTSFLTTNENIHFVFVIKNIFSSRIIYRKKDLNGINEYIVVGEAQHIENCDLFIIKNKIYIFWKGSSGIFCCFSENSGKTFSKPCKYSGKVCQNIKKSFYLSFEQMEIEKFFIRNIYTNTQNIADIQILPELYENFISKTVKTETIEKPEQPKKNNYVQETTFEMLKNQIAMLNNQMASKNKQIERLTEALQRKNEELIFSDKNWKERYKKIFAEKEKLQNELENSKKVSEKSPSEENFSNQENNEI